MGGRKVSDWDDSVDNQAKITRQWRPKKLCFILPMSIHCNTCGAFMYKGTKLGSCMEDVIGETHLGRPKVRFRYKCTECSAEISMKTDPLNPVCGFVVESGARRDFDTCRTEEETRRRALTVDVLRNGSVLDLNLIQVDPGWRRLAWMMWVVIEAHPDA